jgi:hypothetical protein
MTDKFIWLLDGSWPRKGPRLEKGKTYDTADFPAGAVAEWIRTGAAKPAKKEKKPGENG